MYTCKCFGRSNSSLKKVKAEPFTKDNTRLRWLSNLCSFEKPITSATFVAICVNLCPLFETGVFAIAVFLGSQQFGCLCFASVVCVRLSFLIDSVWMLLFSLSDKFALIERIWRPVFAF